MLDWQSHRKLRIFIKVICLVLIAAFVSYDLSWAGATEVLSFNNLASLSHSPFVPPTLKYLSVNEANPRNYFNFLLDKGQLSLTDKWALNREAKQLINYFFLGITLPDNAFWVNLKPGESDRITSEQLTRTDLGRTLLEQDFRLKRDMSQYLNPQNPIGRQFWEKLYSTLGKDKVKKASITTSNRVWIVSADAVVVETEDGALLAKSSLKVLLESEYAALKFKSGRSTPDTSPSGNSDSLQLVTEQLMKEIIIPAITKDVNESQAYASLRQIYHSLILAQWFKRKYRNTNSIYAQAINKGNLQGLESQLPWEKQQIWQDYLKSYKQGEYKIQDTIFGLKRMYFSGGVLFDLSEASFPLKVITQKELPEGLKQDPDLLNSSSLKDDLVVLAEHQSSAQEQPFGEDINVISVPRKLTQGTTVQQAQQGNQETSIEIIKTSPQPQIIESWHNQKGFVLPELLVGLSGLGLIGLSVPLFVSGSLVLGSLTAFLGIAIFVAVLLKPSFPQIKSFVRSKLTIGTISLGLLLSIIFGNPVPTSPNLGPGISQESVAVVQTIPKEQMKPVMPVYLPFYTQSEIRKRADTYSLYINKERSPAIFGMVYQPVPEGQHINEYRGNMAKLYKSLLDESEGGKGHARMLHILGVKAIRIYDISVDDARQIKEIFRKVYQEYGIRVYASNFAGLYENRDYQNPRDRQKIIGGILKTVDTYRDEPWLLGWQIGNEGNYYVMNGKLGQRITLSLPEYYTFMDEIAGAIKQKLNEDLRQQIVILGNGDLTEEEAGLISRMQNIDAVGINCFRDKAGVASLLKLAKERISMPIIISEIGRSARTAIEQQTQSQYLNDVISLLDENSIGRGKLGNVAMVFICEATDELWKAIDSTKPEEAYLGILSKSSETDLRNLFSEIERINKYVMPPTGVESEDLIRSAWAALEVKNYGLAIRYANDCIKLWSEQAQRQQRDCVQTGEFPNTDLIKAGSNEFLGKKYDVYTRKVFNYWALNDVGAAYLIIGKAAFEQGRQAEANAAFNEILTNYSYAQIQIGNNRVPVLRLIIIGRDGSPSRGFELVEQGKTFEDVGYFKVKDMILGKENKSSPPSLSSEDLTRSAWQFLVNRDYDSAIAYADKCIELYQQKASEQQAEALSLRRLPKTEKEIWKYWALNDVGTSYFIKIRVAYEQADKQKAREIYDELVKNYSQAQVRDLEGKYWSLKNAVRVLYPDLLPGLISIDKTKAALYALGTLALIIIRSIIGSIGSVLNFFGLKRKNRGSLASQVENVSVMSKRDKITFLALVFGELYLLFNFAAWWFHPIRMEYYIVSFPLFGFLSYLGACGIIFYTYVWHLVWSMKKPKYMAPATGLKVAMATTFIESEPIELVKETLLKMRQVSYPHDTFVLDESNNQDLAVFCQQNGIIHFTRKGIAKYHQPQPPFQAKTKGGNLNAWLDTYGKNYKFVTFLDPDHQPEPVFLDRILGYFNDSKVGFVQAPHVYKNADERWIARGGAEQNYYFVGPIQMGLYGNNAAVVNGSHSTFRIKALESIGGYGVHNADDMLTSLRLHAKGWQGVFVPEVLAEGLTPATWGPYLQQQYRWSNSMFDMMFFKYPGQFPHLKLRQILGYLMLGSWYFLQINLLLLMILPIISVAINQPPVNLELVNFLKWFMPFYLSQMLILIGWSQKFLLKPQVEKGVWWRGGMLWVASSIYITYSFIRAIFKQGLLRTKFVTPKTTETGVSYLRLFAPHIILVGILVLTLGHTYFLDSYLWPTKGMKLFLVMSITSLTGLIITSTKWFSNWYLKRRSNRKISNNITLGEFQDFHKADIDKTTIKRDNIGRSSSPVSMENKFYNTLIEKSNISTNPGGIDLSNIEMTLKDEKFVSNLNPADRKILQAARALREGQNSLAVLYIHEIRLLLKDKILSEKDIAQRELLQSLLVHLERRELLDLKAIEFSHIVGG